MKFPESNASCLFQGQHTGNTTVVTDLPPLLCFTLLLRAAREELKERSPTADVGKVLHVGSHQRLSAQDGMAVPLTSQLAMKLRVRPSPCFSEKGVKEKQGSTL